MTGIGDDCAILPQGDGQDLLVSTDLLVEGVHFLRDGIAPFDLGWKTAAVNLSDIAAMGGQPVATFLCSALCGDLPAGWMLSFLEGYKAVSERFGAALLGGDTSRSLSQLCFNVTVLGRCPSNRAVRRNAAWPGDRICVTGFLGDSAAGLKSILAGLAETPLVQRLRTRHTRPFPRVEEGLSLAGMPGIGAMMDISDGVAADLPHILEESGTGAVVDTTSLPLSDELRALCTAEGWDAVELALCGGEDYELLFTCRPDARIPVPHQVIGEIVPGNGIRWEGSDRDFAGFEHKFGK